MTPRPAQDIVIEEAARQDWRRLWRSWSCPRDPPGWADILKRICNNGDARTGGREPCRAEKRATVKRVGPGGSNGT